MRTSLFPIPRRGKYVGSCNLSNRSNPISLGKKYPINAEIYPNLSCPAGRQSSSKPISFCQVEVSPAPKKVWNWSGPPSIESRQTRTTNERRIPLSLRFSLFKFTLVSLCLRCLKPTLLCLLWRVWLPRLLPAPLHFITTEIDNI